MQRGTTLALLFVCLVLSSQCFLFDLLKFKAGLVGNFFSLFTNHWGLDSKVSHQSSQTLNDNVWRDSKPTAPPPSYQEPTKTSIQVNNFSPLTNIFNVASNVNRVDVTGTRYTVNNENVFRNNVRPDSVALPSNQDWSYYPDQIGGWRVSNGQSGIGRIYNNRWGNLRVLQLDTTENQVYKYSVHLPGGSYELNFDYAARQGSPVQTSRFSVRWNGQDIGSFAPGNYDIYHFKAIVQSGTNNQLRLIAEGKSDCLGITVANFALFKAYSNTNYPGFVNDPTDLPITYITQSVFPSIENYVLNGDFEASRIPSGIVYGIPVIPSWQNDFGQIGFGQNYNMNWAPKTQLIHLDSGRNVKYTHRVQLKKGQKYQISFDWAARDGKRLDTSQVQVRFNGKNLSTLKPRDYYCHRHTVVVDGVDGLNVLDLIGAGDQDRYGASIDNVVVCPYRNRK